MNRRRFLQCAAGACLAPLGAALQATPKRPNVLFLSVDDMNDYVGYLDGYGGPSPTPNIDRLASRGVGFTNAHCAAPVCNPSRTAVMTGLRPSTSGIYNNGQWWRPHLADVTTLPECFRAQGYESVGGGKVFHHTLGNNPPGLWDAYFPQVADDHWHYDYPVPGQHVQKPGLHWPDGFPLNGLDAVAQGKRPPGNYREFDWGPMDKPDGAMGDGQTVQWALDYLAQPHDKPFFLAAGIYRPHLPWYAPQDHFAPFALDDIALPELKADDLDDVPPIGKKFAQAHHADFQLVRDADQYQRALQAYLASIHFADALVGRLLDGLDKSPHARNTIVVLWSDHGWHHGQKGAWHKSTLWERATRVPCVIWAPGLAGNGTVCNQPVSLVDLYPTLVDLCGLKPPGTLDGTSLRPVLEEPGQTWERPALVTCGRGNHAIRSTRWRYIRYHDGTDELYDHDADPNEWTNLAGVEEHAPIKAELARWLPQVDAPDAPAKKAYRFDPSSYTWTRK